MPKITAKKLQDVEFYVKAAKTHGEGSDPDHEAGDLQGFLRAAWSLLTPEQKLEFSKLEEVRSTLEGALGLFDGELDELIK